MTRILLCCQLAGVLAFSAFFAQGVGAQELKENPPRYAVIELGTLGGTYSQTFYVNQQWCGQRGGEPG